MNKGKRELQYVVIPQPPYLALDDVSPEMPSIDSDLQVQYFLGLVVGGGFFRRPGEVRRGRGGGGVRGTLGRRVEIEVSFRPGVLGEDKCSFAPYVEDDPNLRKFDFEKMRIEEFERRMNLYGPLRRTLLTVRKGGASGWHFDTDELIRAKGGDPDTQIIKNPDSFKLSDDRKFQIPKPRSSFKLRDARKG